MQKRFPNKITVRIEEEYERYAYSFAGKDAEGNDAEFFYVTDENGKILSIKKSNESNIHGAAANVKKVWRGAHLTLKGSALYSYNKAFASQNGVENYIRYDAASAQVSASWDKFGWLTADLTVAGNMTWKRPDAFSQSANVLKNVFGSLRLDFVPLKTLRLYADAAATAWDAWQAAKARGAKWLIIDTAGRLHTKENLMGELAKIRRVLEKHDATAPQNSIIVLDGSLGSNSIEQAKAFHKAFGLTGMIITKLDGTGKGGALAGIYRELKLPILYVGLGEKAEDLQKFNIRAYANGVFGLDRQ